MRGRQPALPVGIKRRPGKGKRRRVRAVPRRAYGPTTLPARANRRSVDLQIKSRIDLSVSRPATGQSEPSTPDAAKGCPCALRVCPLTNPKRTLGESHTPRPRRSPGLSGSWFMVNMRGTGVSVVDKEQYYATNLSHEMTVEPTVGGALPEVCDACGPNCQSAIIDFFKLDGTYLGSEQWPTQPAYSFDLQLNAIVRPRSSGSCPAPPERLCLRSPRPSCRGHGPRDEGTSTVRPGH